MSASSEQQKNSSGATSAARIGKPTMSLLLCSGTLLTQFNSLPRPPSVRATAPFMPPRSGRLGRTFQQRPVEVEIGAGHALRRKPCPGHAAALGAVDRGDI